MGVQTKTIGRQPTDHGPYDPQLAYGKKFIVELFDCGWESKKENNTSAPATLDAQAGTITPNTNDWIKRYGSYKQWLIDNGYQKMDASNVKDGNMTQHVINAAVADFVASKGSVNGLASLDGSGKVPSSQLPSYVDDVIEGYYYEGAFYSDAEHTTEITAESGKIYVDLSSDASFRWTGSAYREISNLDAVEAERTRAMQEESVLSDRINGKQNALTFDNTPTANSTNPVTSGGIKSALDAKLDSGNVYTKSEVNSLVTTPSSVVQVGALPSSGSLNTIYRVPGTNSYSDYGWNGSTFVKLGTFSISADMNSKLYLKTRLIRRVRKTSGGEETFGLARPFIQQGETFCVVNKGSSSVVVGLNNASAIQTSSVTAAPGENYFSSPQVVYSLTISSVCDLELHHAVLGIEESVVVKTKHIRTVVKNITAAESFGIPTYVFAGSWCCFINNSNDDVTVGLGDTNTVFANIVVPGMGEVYYKVPASNNITYLHFGPSNINLSFYNAALARDAVAQFYNDFPFLGKKVVTYGDSLVQGGGWQDYVATLGCTVINSGIGGSTLAYRDKEQYVNSDGKFTGDPDEGYTPVSGDTLINDTGSGVQRMSFIAADADYVIVYLGTNDFAQNKPIGTFADEDNSTFKGAIKALTSWIRANRPDAKLIYCTPAVTASNANPNSLGLYQHDYVKAILDAEIELGLPVLNLWARLPFGIENISTYTTDGTHWNNAGKKAVGNVVTGYLLSEKPLG